MLTSTVELDSRLFEFNMENISSQSKSAPLSAAWFLKNVVSRCDDSSSQTPPLALGLRPESGSGVRGVVGGG